MATAYKQRVNLMPFSVWWFTCYELLRTTFLSSEHFHYCGNRAEEIKISHTRWRRKYHKRHIGKANKSWLDLNVHGTSMQEVQHDDYLGDNISADGKIQKPFKAGLLRELLYI